MHGCRSTIIPELYWKKQIVLGMEEKIGEVSIVDMNGTGSDTGDFVWVRVWIDVRKNNDSHLDYLRGRESDCDEGEIRENSKVLCQMWFSWTRAGGMWLTSP
jgi:hypothetical protein